MQPSDVMLLNGASGTGKTIACLNAACMTMKISDESRVIICVPSACMVIGILDLIKRECKYINHIEQILNNLTIITLEEK